MPTLSYASYTTQATDLDVSHISGLEVFRVNGKDILYATTRLDGYVSAWDISGSGVTLIDADSYGRTAIAGGDPALVMVNDALLTGGGVAGQMVLRPLADNGAMGQAAAVGANLFTYPLGAATSFVQSAGNTFVYAQLVDGNGLAYMALDANDQIIRSRTALQGDITAIASATVGAVNYVFTGTNTESAGLTSWSVRNNGILDAVETLNGDTGLWIAAPTALDSAVVDGQTYLVLGSAGSNSLSVMSVAAGGTLTITDHLLDDRNSRFGAITDLEVVAVHGHTYVIAGGGDDGISVYQLLPGGQLLARAHIADSTGMGLSNVSAVAAATDATGIDIFVGSSAETGITTLRFDIGPAGIIATVGTDNARLLGTAYMDMLIGTDAANQLVANGGDDILFDGAGRDTLSGGAGADTFILAYDETLDIITDFDPNIDILDLSAWPGLRSMAQLVMRTTDRGIQITYGNEVLELRSVDGKPITPDMLNESQMFSGTRLPQTIVTGFAGPAVTPVLPVYDPPTPPPDTSTKPVSGLTLRGTENADVMTGSAVNDTLRGMGGNDTMRGLDGADWMNGQVGNDQLYGGTGADILIGGEGRGAKIGTQGANADTLYGEADNDQLFGQSGHDVLNGGAGDDIMTGGSGRDTFIFNDGYDLVTDFSVYADTLVFEDNLWAGTLTTKQVLDRYATVQGDSVVFDFGNGDILILAEVDSKQGLSDLMSFI